jgi:hypothetical protein
MSYCRLGVAYAQPYVWQYEVLGLSRMFQFAKKNKYWGTM